MDLDDASRSIGLTPEPYQGDAPTSFDLAVPWEGMATLGTDARYSVEGSLGQGGMGEVLLVRDEVIGREVAMKVIRAKHSTRRRVVRRFLTEAKVQARLEHPVIVPLYDMGRRADGSMFFTMKRIRGESLRSVIEGLAGRGMARGQAPQRRLLAAFSQVCLAIHYAHERGVVHRDLKPGNIMMGGYGEVYVIDWGVAKIRGVADEESGSTSDALGVEESDGLTQDHDMLGTVGYMAPEQITESNSEVDARSDVYALGAILFEIISLRRLHAQPDRDERVRSTLAGVGPKARLEELGIDAPPELVAACEKALAHDRSERTTTAREIAEAVDAYLEGDRNQVLRRDLAGQYAESARDAAAHLEEDADESAKRTEALHAVGQALALDPENRSALRTLVQLLTQPPTTVPEEVRAEDEASRLGQMRTGAVLGLCAYAFAAVSGPWLYVLGFHSTTLFFLTQVAWFVPIAFAVLIYFRPSYPALFAMLVGGVIATTCAAQFLSPFLLIPAILVVHGIVFGMVHGWRRRIAVIAIVLGGWTVCALGPWLGAMRNLISYPPQGILIHLGYQLDGRGMNLYMYVTVFASLALTAAIAGAVRATSAKHEMSARLTAWQLKQLVPEGPSGS